MICLNTNISVRNNQAFSQESLNINNDIFNTLSEWYNRSYSKLDILNYIIKSVSVYGINSHPSQKTIGKHAGVQRGWVNIVTNELVEMGLINKRRVIINGDEMACEYSLTEFFKDSNVCWMLKDILPALKLFSIFKKKEAQVQTDNTPYIDIYFKKNFKILRTRTKSISRKQFMELSENKDENSREKRSKIMKDVERDYSWQVYKQNVIEEQRKKEEQENLVAASQDEGFVSFLQGLLNGI